MEENDNDNIIFLESYLFAVKPACSLSQSVKYGSLVCGSKEDGIKGNGTWL